MSNLSLQVAHHSPKGRPSPQLSLRRYLRSPASMSTRLPSILRSSSNTPARRSLILALTLASLCFHLYLASLLSRVSSALSDTIASEQDDAGAGGEGGNWRRMELLRLGVGGVRLTSWLSAGVAGVGAVGVIRVSDDVGAVLQLDRKSWLRQESGPHTRGRECGVGCAYIRLMHWDILSHRIICPSSASSPSTRSSRSCSTCSSSRSYPSPSSPLHRPLCPPLYALCSPAPTSLWTYLATPSNLARSDSAHSS